MLMFDIKRSVIKLENEAVTLFLSVCVYRSSVLFSLQENHPSRAGFVMLTQLCTGSKSF